MHRIFTAGDPARGGYPVTRPPDMTLPREPRFNFYGASIVLRVATLLNLYVWIYICVGVYMCIYDAPARSRGFRRPQWTPAPSPTPPASPFRIKGKKSRGASLRHCVTCRCGWSVRARPTRRGFHAACACLSVTELFTHTCTARWKKSRNANEEERERENVEDAK